MYSVKQFSQKLFGLASPDMNEAIPNDNQQNNEKTRNDPHLELTSSVQYRYIQITGPTTERPDTWANQRMPHALPESWVED